MLSGDRRVLPPRMLRRYLGREFAGFLVPILASFILLYLIVDLFDRLDFLLKNNATLSAGIRYFLFKIPLIITQILPPAVVVSVLLAYGMASRRNEITALRAGGVSLVQSSIPILVVAAAISALALAWNETVVPYCTHYYQQVNIVEIRKRDRRSLLSEHEIWYHGQLGFYNIAHVDPKKQMLFEVAVYQAAPEFVLHRVIRIPTLEWTGGRWIAQAAAEHVIHADGTVSTRNLRADELQLPERFEDFLEVQQEPEELSYFALRRRIAELSGKGINASDLLVDLNLKLAIPFASLVLACVAIPLAGRVRRHPSLAAIVGTGAVAGFGYWVLLGLSNSLGQSGVLPPLVAAWSANFVYGLLSLTLFLRAE